LSVGLILGLPGYSLVEKSIYSSMLVLAMFIIDHPNLLIRKRIRKLSLTLDGTNIGDGTLKQRVEEMLGREVDEVTVKNVIALPPSTKVEVRFTESSK
jgi:hypothetical protein